MLRDMDKIAVLDIGTAKTKVCLGQYDHLGRIEILSAEMVKTRGMEHGIIVDMGEVARCIEEVVCKIEEKNILNQSERFRFYSPKQTKINSVYATLNGEHINGINTRTIHNLSNVPVEITQQDMQRIIEAAKTLTLNLEREILHVLPQEFIIDGHEGIKDPLGIYGTKLGVNLHIISCSTSCKSSLIKAINRAGLDVDGIAFSGLAASFLTLTEREKEGGVILLDFGAGTVNILFFKNGSLCYTNVIGEGGFDITDEISKNLSIDLGQAEQLKMQYHSSFKQETKDTQTEDKIIIKKNFACYESVNRQDLKKIIDKKITVLLERIKSNLELADVIKKANCGIVVCGGLSFMEGIIERLEDKLKLPVRLGVVRGFVSSLTGVNNIFYASSVGLVAHALSKQASNTRSLLGRGVLGQFFNKIKNVYEEYF